MDKHSGYHRMLVQSLAYCTPRNIIHCVFAITLLLVGLFNTQQVAATHTPSNRANQICDARLIFENEPGRHECTLTADEYMNNSCQYAGGYTPGTPEFNECKVDYGGEVRACILAGYNHLACFDNVEESMFANAEPGKDYWNFGETGEPSLGGGGGGTQPPSPGDPPDQGDPVVFEPPIEADFTPAGGQLEVETGPVSCNLDASSEPTEGSNPIACRLIQIINVLSVGVGIVITISLVYAGILYTTSRGDPAQTKKAIDRAWQAGIALLLYIFGWALLNFLIPGGVLNPAVLNLTLGVMTL